MRKIHNLVWSEALVWNLSAILGTNERRPKLQMCFSSSEYLLLEPAKADFTRCLLELPQTIYRTNELSWQQLVAICNQPFFGQMLTLDLKGIFAKSSQ